MATEIDEHGKRFTEVIRKTPTRVMIQTPQGRIEGIVHIGPERRLSDELNDPAPFVPVTQANLCQAGEKQFVPFLLVGRNQILWVRPVEESEDSHEQ